MSRYYRNNNRETFIRNNNTTFTWDIDPGWMDVIGLPMDLYSGNWSVESILTTCLECNSKTVSSYNEYTSDYPDVCAFIKNVTSTSLDINIINHENIDNFEFRLSGLNITGITKGDIIYDWGLFELNGNTITASTEGFDNSGRHIPPGNWDIIHVEFTNLDDTVCFDSVSFIDTLSEELYSIAKCSDWSGTNNEGGPSVIGTGVGAMFGQNENSYLGSLMELDPRKGYYVLMPLIN